VSGTNQLALRKRFHRLQVIKRIRIKLINIEKLKIEELKQSRMTAHLPSFFPCRNEARD
jgi:hypothetical protein